MYSQGDVLLIPIPFTDLSTNKKRPVLVLSNSDYNNKTDDIIVAAITSNIDDKEYSIVLKKEDMIEGKLKVESCIRADKLYTLSKSIVISKFGKVGNDIINKVRSNIHKILIE